MVFYEVLNMKSKSSRNDAHNYDIRYVEYEAKLKEQPIPAVAPIQERAVETPTPDIPDDLLDRLSEKPN